MITIVLPEWVAWIACIWFALNALNGVLYLIIKWLDYCIKKKISRMGLFEFNDYLKSK